MTTTLIDLLAEWTVPAAILVVGAVVGVVVERIVLVWVRRVLDRTPLSTPGRVVGAMRGASMEIVALVAAYIALGRSPLTGAALRTSQDVLYVLVALVITTLVARLAAAVIRMYMERSDGALPTSSIFVNIARAFVFVIAGLIVMEHFGVAIGPLVTALGVGGIAVALALQETLASLFAGLQILAARQFEPGDFIELETGEAGEIIDITWRNTIIRTLRENEVVIPNSKMASTIVTNYESPAKELSIIVPGGVAYGSDLDRVEAVTLEVAEQTVSDLFGDFEDWEPTVRFSEFADSAIEFNVVLRATEFRDRYLLRHEFLKRLKKRFDEEGIEIPFPQRVVHSADESSS